MPKQSTFSLTSVLNQIKTEEVDSPAKVDTSTEAKKKSIDSFQTSFVR